MPIFETHAHESCFCVDNYAFDLLNRSTRARFPTWGTCIPRGTFAYPK